ncbi:hypothetical protein CON65_15805 [Bacillus pseudomycoides]|uniref:Uncharacterized protein n=1 Tax=Bacillus pseudomycoides TaxID=64104 RepID=A0AA91ZTI4_9BACI|nr:MULTISPECIES: hypothetical protein [Bacillus]PEB56223.1 hypothetical protein COO03_01240 [Bacillus sp. AFS098217]PED81653.1 hypothetical protein CON65_15805 [Bacillus pseudomycoides]
MLEQLTMEDAVVYEQIDTYMVDIVTSNGFRLEFCEAETKEEAALTIRERFRKDYNFRIRGIEVSNRSLKEIEELD